jgi:hypothetical protein
MQAPTETLGESGLDVNEIGANSVFSFRPPRVHDTSAEFAALQRIAGAFVDQPESMLQELVDAAIELCGADSAGISLEMPNATDDRFYHWVATAGQYSGFLDAVLPRYPSACGVCLQRGEPQHFLVGQRFYSIMGIEAPLVTDGLLLPWKVDGTRGTIFIMAHGRTEAFDLQDCRVMETLANFAAMGIRQSRQRQLILEQGKAAAAAAMANELAHKINNPLQALSNMLYIAAQGYANETSQSVGRNALDQVDKLSLIVKELLALPYRDHP